MHLFDEDGAKLIEFGLSKAYIPDADNENSFIVSGYFSRKWLFLIVSWQTGGNQERRFHFWAMFSEAPRV